MRAQRYVFVNLQATQKDGQVVDNEGQRGTMFNWKLREVGVNGFNSDKCEVMQLWKSSSGQTCN